MQSVVTTLRKLEGDQRATDMTIMAPTFCSRLYSNTSQCQFNVLMFFFSNGTKFKNNLFFSAKPYVLFVLGLTWFSHLRLNNGI